MDPETPCTDPSPALQAALVAYLYDECEPEEQQQVESHIAECQHCAGELESLRSVRGTLDAWTPPEHALGVRVVAGSDRGRSRWLAFFEPSWGLAAAAALVLVVGAAIATVEIRYDAQGFAFRMGWTPSQEPAAPEVVGLIPGPVADDGQAPWRADLAMLENELRRDLTVSVNDRPSTGSSDVSPDGAALLDEMSRLIAQSERRQGQELALWFTEFAQEFDMQRRADQQRFQSEIGALEGYTDYLVRTAGR